jgi:hypothetical protein
LVVVVPVLLYLAAAALVAIERERNRSQGRLPLLLLLVQALQRLPLLAQLQFLAPREVTLILPRPPQLLRQEVVLVPAHPDSLEVLEAQVVVVQTGQHQEPRAVQVIRLLLHHLKEIMAVMELV